jgi:hypothetical protein
VAENDVTLEELGRIIEERRSYYRGTFQDTDVGKRVLGDLFHICCAGRTTFVGGDPHATLINEGKRQVWLHIVSMLNASDADIWYLAEQRVNEDRPVF